MKLRTKNILLAIGVLILWLVVFFSAKDVKKSSYGDGYVAGFKKGLDTASAMNDKEFDAVMDSAWIILRELEAMQVDSFPNHSEIK